MGGKGERTMPATDEETAMTAPRPPRVWIVDLPALDPTPKLGTCQFTMRGKTRTKRTKAGPVHRAGWSQRCPRKATVEWRGRLYCEMHRPAASLRPAKENERE